VDGHDIAPMGAIGVVIEFKQIIGGGMRL